MVSTRGLRYKFSEGERVLCYEPDPTKAKVLYDSKVLEVIESKDKRGRRTVEYLIHFQGWNSSWDRCVSEDFILKDSQENRQLQRDLAEKAQLQLGAYLYRREPKKRVNTTAHPGPAKRARHGCSDAGSSTSTQPDEVEPGDTDSSSGSATSSGSDSGSNSSGSQQRLQHKPPAFKADIPIPPALRDRLTFDYHLVVKRGRLSRLPASPCAAEILESFVKWFAHTGVWQATRTRHAPAQRPDIPDVSCRLHLVREVAEGIRIYIDFILGDHLLYRQEQNQYWQICGQYNEDVKPKSESEDSQEEDTGATDEERNSPKMPEYSHLPPDPVRNQNDKENDTENEDETEDDEEDDGDNDDEEDNEEDREVEDALHNNVENHSHESETEEDDEEQDESDVQDNGNNEDTEHNNIENEVNNALQDDTENEDENGHSNEENEDNVLHNNVVNLVQNAVHNIENNRDDSVESNEDNDEDSVNNDAENENDVHNNVRNNDGNIVHNNGQNVPNNVENDEDEDNSEEEKEHHNAENGDESLQNDAEDMDNDLNRQNEVEQSNEEDDGQNDEDDDEEMDVDDVNDENNDGENDDGENDQGNYEDEDSKSKVMESIDGRNSYNYATSSSDPNNECDGEDVKVKVEVKVERVKVEASSEEVEPCEEVRPRARRARCVARSGNYARRLRSYKSNKSHSESEEQAPSTSTGGEQRPFDTQSSSVESTMSSLSEEWRGAGRAPPAPPTPPTPPSPPTLKRTPLSLLLEKVSKWRVIPRDESTKHLPCRIYGATHLARLFVKLPEFLNATNMAESKLKIILKNIDMFVQYLDQHGEWFGEVHYMSDGRSDSH